MVSHLRLPRTIALLSIYDLSLVISAFNLQVHGYLTLTQIFFFLSSSLNIASDQNIPMQQNKHATRRRHNSMKAYNFQVTMGSLSKYCWTTNCITLLILESLISMEKLQIVWFLGIDFEFYFANSFSKSIILSPTSILSDHALLTFLTTSRHLLCCHDVCWE